MAKDSPFPLFANGAEVDADLLDDINSNARNFGLPKTSPGWKFVGWEWTIGGVTYTTVDGKDELPTTVTCTMSLTAIFRLSGQVLSFDANGGTVTAAGATSMSATRYLTGADAKLPEADAVVRDGYVFTGWGMTKDGAAIYAPGQIIQMFIENTTLYAILGGQHLHAGLRYPGWFGHRGAHRRALHRHQPA